MSDHTFVTNIFIVININIPGITTRNHWKTKTYFWLYLIAMFDNRINDYDLNLQSQTRNRKSQRHLKN